MFGQFPVQIHHLTDRGVEACKQHVLDHDDGQGVVGDLLLVQSEKGEVALLEPNPDELRELTRFQALDGKTWNPPALAGRYLLVRNHREAVCYELPAS